MGDRLQSIKKSLVDLESRIAQYAEESDIKSMLEAEKEYHILKVFYHCLESSLTDSTFLDRKGIELEINDKVLKSLSIEQKMEVVCLTKGKCGV